MSPLLIKHVLSQVSRHLLLLQLLLAASLPSNAEDLYAVPPREVWNQNCGRYLDKHANLDAFTRPNLKKLDPGMNALVVALRARSICSCQYRHFQDKETFTLTDVQAAQDACQEEMTTDRGFFNKYIPDSPLTPEEMDSVMESASAD